MDRVNSTTPGTPSVSMSDSGGPYPPPRAHEVRRPDADIPRQAAQAVPINRAARPRLPGAGGGAGSGPGNAPTAGHERDSAPLSADLTTHTSPDRGEHEQGYVSNSLDAPATSEAFTMWAAADSGCLGIGSIVRHQACDLTGHVIETHAILVACEGIALGLERRDIAPYEVDRQVPLAGIVPAPSRRRPIAYYRARVLSTSADAGRPILPGTVTPVAGREVLAAHLPFGELPRDEDWLKAEGMVLGFYADGLGGFGPFAEERARVLGPRQGHVILSGMPGSGKTSLYLTLVTCLFSALRAQQAGQGDSPVPTAASIAFNVKGADLLFLDHIDPDGPRPEDLAMWRLAGVDTSRPPFGRVRLLVPLAGDGLNRLSLRNNPAADVVGYSMTLPFALGIAELWPYLDLLFDDRSSAAINLLAEIRHYFEARNEGAGGDFTLAHVLELFETRLLPDAARRLPEFSGFQSNTIQAVFQRLRGLPATLGGLVDVTGTGFGLDTLANLAPYDLLMIDLERVLANPPEPELATAILKIVTGLVLRRITDAVTRHRSKVDHVIVFADELNTLAPASGRDGIGEYLAHLARTTRDRGIVLFGAGQFRSAVSRDLLKAAAVHVSMQTPQYELQDPLYADLTIEMKAQLASLLPGRFLLQFPSMRQPVFARFPRPFLLMGSAGLKAFPELPPRSIGECIAGRLQCIDGHGASSLVEVTDLVDGMLASVGGAGQRDGMVRELREHLRRVELEYTDGRADRSTAVEPWERYFDLVIRGAPASRSPSAARAAALPGSAGPHRSGARRDRETH